MKESKRELEKAIIKLGEAINIKENTTRIMLRDLGIYTTIREFTFLVFTNNYNDYFEKDNETFESVQLIRKYCKEMNENGEVNFDMPI